MTINFKNMGTYMKKLTLLSLVVASSLYAGGYKIPETSVNGTALSAANVAQSHGADAAYYNPANMVFMEDAQNIEVDLMFVALDATNFVGSGAMAGVDIDAESEFFEIPSINYVSGKLGDARVGLSIAVPGGLTKRWDVAPAIYTAEEFTLQVVEINPTVAFPIGDNASIAFGFRMIHSEGIVKSTSTLASRDMTGDSWDYGYNLALSYKPTSELSLAATYRSNITLTEEGTAKLGMNGTTIYDGGSSVSVPLPALLNIAVAYTLPTDTTIEFVYERNYWSAYSDLDFDYAGSIGGLTPVFDDPIAKDWEDTTALRLGVTQELDALTLMAGIVIDETPIPEEKVSFELPDSDSLSVSFGGRYQINESWNAGIGVLYSMRDERKVANDDIEGEFSNSNIVIVSLGAGYKF